MKKIIPSILIILVVLIALFLIFGKNEKSQVLENNNQDQIASNLNSRSCYEYNHQATKTEPYTNYELMDLTRNGGVITGTKVGTQTGPDMTNGYEGSLAGTIDGDTIDVVFSYVIEGSSQKEKEIYRVTDDSLTKLRYVLVEEDGILVPDLSSIAKELVYKKVACQNDEPKNNDDWIFLSDPTSELTFFYPKDFGTKYIHTVDWPPKVSKINDPYVCEEGGDEISGGGETTEISVGGNTYCRTVSSEGAAGSVYTNYSYLSRLDSENTVRMDFSIKLVQCLNYDEPEKSECLAERDSFDIDKIVDQILVSVSRSEK